MKLIENTWHDRFKIMTVKLGAYLSAFFSLAILFSEQFLYLWSQVPQDLKDKVPSEWGFYIGLAVSVAMTIVRLKPQPELHQIQSFAAVASKPPELAWIAEARKHIGLREIVGNKHNQTILSWIKGLGGWFKDDETPWCGTYVAHCLKTAGIAYPKHWYRALDYLNYGAKLAKPAYGCVAVKTRKGGGHVCFVVGRDAKTGKLVCLGGNQSNMVCFALYAESEFEAFMWYGKTSSPADHRYNLPILSGITATKVTEA